MDVAEVITQMHQEGFTLAANGERLSVSPSDRLTDRLRQLIRDHKPAILDALRSPGQILDANQPGNDIEPANNPQPLTVQAWTPAGILMLVEASSVEHAQWIERMNPPPIPERAVRCCDCTNAIVTAGIARCAVGVESGLPIAGFWATDRHRCGEYQGAEGCP